MSTSDVCKYIARHLRAYQQKQDDAPASAMMHFQAALLAAELNRVPLASEIFDSFDDLPKDTSHGS